MSEFTDNMPILGVYVRKEYLKNFQDGFGDFVYGRIFSVKSIKGRALLFDIHLENGAIYRGLPVSAFCKNTDKTKEKANYICTIHNYSRHSRVDTTYSEFPSEDKDFYMLLKENGNYCLFPTNMILAVDGSFTKLDNKPDLSRNETKYLSENGFNETSEKYLYDFLTDNKNK